MWIAKMKVVVAAVFAVVALGVGVAYRSEAVQAEQVEQASPVKPRSELEALRRENELLKLNLEVVLEKVRTLEKEVRALRGKPGLPEAGLELPLQPQLERRMQYEERKAKVPKGERGFAYKAVPVKPQEPERDFAYKAVPVKPQEPERDFAYKAVPAKPQEPERDFAYKAVPAKPSDGERGNRYRALELKERPDADGVRQAEAALRALRDAKDQPSRRRALDALDRALRALRALLPDDRREKKNSP
jgi:hypothetical protein